MEKPQLHRYKIIIRKLPARNFTINQFHENILKILNKLNIPNDQLIFESFTEGKFSRLHGPVSGIGYVSTSNKDVCKLLLSAVPNKIPFLDLDNDQVNKQPDVCLAPYNKTLKKNSNTYEVIYKQQQELITQAMVVDNPPPVPSETTMLPPTAPATTTQQVTTKLSKSEAYTKSKEFAQFLESLNDKSDTASTPSYRSKVSAPPALLVYLKERDMAKRKHRKKNKNEQKKGGKGKKEGEENLDKKRGKNKEKKIGNKSVVDASVDASQGRPRKDNNRNNSRNNNRSEQAAAVGTSSSNDNNNAPRSESKNAGGRGRGGRERGGKGGRGGDSAGAGRGSDNSATSMPMRIMRKES